MLNQLVIKQRARSTESAAMHRFRLSKRLGVLVDHIDCLDAAGADTTSARGEIRRTLAAMASLDELLTNGGQHAID